MTASATPLLSPLPLTLAGMSSYLPPWWVLAGVGLMAGAAGWLVWRANRQLDSLLIQVDDPQLGTVAPLPASQERLAVPSDYPDNREETP